MLYFFEFYIPNFTKHILFDTQVEKLYQFLTDHKYLPHEIVQDDNFDLTLQQTEINMNESHIGYMDTVWLHLPSMPKELYNKELYEKHAKRNQNKKLYIM